MCSDLADLILSRHLRIHHLSTFDQHQGAAKAAWRIHDALRDLGHQSKMFVAEKISDDPDVLKVPQKPRLKWAIESRIQAMSQSRQTQTTGVGWFDHDLDGQAQWKEIAQYPCDVIFLHLTRNFIPVSAVAKLVRKLQAPVISVPVDVAPMTGGCHHHMDCAGFMRECGNCPQLKNGHRNDVSHKNWRTKQKHLTNLEIVFVAPTTWVADRLFESSLFRNHRRELIPLSIDPENYGPGDQKAARLALNLPQDKKLVFFGSHEVNDPRKGYAYLLEALRFLSDGTINLGMDLDDLHLVIAGKASYTEESELPFRFQHLGYVDEARLADAYRAADLFVCPSVYDAGPLMIPEAMMCGTPVVAFDSGGAPDLIRSGENGYLASYRDSCDLALGIAEVLRNPGSLGRQAHFDAISRHSPHVIGQKYDALLRELTRAGC